VKSILQYLDIIKETGAAHILKVCSAELPKPLALLLNRSLGRVPVQWKLLNISPVHKAMMRESSSEICTHPSTCSILVDSHFLVNF